MVYGTLNDRYLRPRLRLSKGNRIFWGDRLAGAWSIPFIAIMAVTAGWFLIQAALDDNHVTISTAGAPLVVARGDVPIVAKGAPSPQITLERAATEVRAQLPDLEPSFVQLPGNAYGYIRVGGRGAYPLLFETAEVKLCNGTVARTRRVSDLSALELIAGSMRPLHTGDFAGVWLKLVYFAFGLLLTVLVFSGMMVWTRRTALETVKIVRERRQARLERRVVVASLALSRQRLGAGCADRLGTGAFPRQCVLRGQEGGLANARSAKSRSGPGAYDWPSSVSSRRKQRGAPDMPRHSQWRYARLASMR